MWGYANLRTEIAAAALTTPQGLVQQAVVVGDNLIETHALTKRYGEHRAVDQLDLTVRRGEIYGFLGPNGAGKTTTLRILLGLVRATSGTVRVLDADPGDPKALANIGVLVESAAFYPYLSGRDNLRAFARYCKVPDARVEEVLEIVSLTDRGSDKFAKYSLGMKQRLGLAAALLKDPELLILDEPTNGLDPAGITDMRRLIRKLGRDGHTVVLSSHLLGEVQQICDRVGMIARGKLVREGTVDELRGTATLEVVAEPLAQAREIVAQLIGAEKIIGSDNALRLNAKPTDAVRINRELVLAGIAVSSLHWIERSLEEIFFEVTDEPEAELTTTKGGV